MTHQDSINPGRYSNIANDTYHSGPGISKSHLDKVAVTPLHYWATYIDPDRGPRDKTEALILGSAVDASLFEPDSFLDNFIVMPEAIRVGRSNVAKDERADWIREVAGSRQIIKRSDMDVCIGIQNAVIRHPIIRNLIMTGDHQEVFYAIDPETGLLVKCKPDNLLPKLAVDFKTSADASQRAFSFSARTYRYDVQADWYPWVMGLAGAEKPENFVFVVAEKEPPWALGLYYAKPFHFERGRRLARENLNTLHRCFEHDYWPDYAEEAKPLLEV